MVHFPSQKELQELKKLRKPHCLTVYMTFDGNDSDPNHNRIEYKNMLQRASVMLADSGAKPQAVETTLAPMRALLESAEFLAQKHGDLAIFAHSSLFRVYHIPTGTFMSAVKVQHGFATDQLEKAMQQNRSYYVLALSRKKTQLYKGDQFGLKPVTVKNMPPDMQTALQIDEYPHSRQFHSVTHDYRGAGSASTHDQAEVKNTDKEMAFEFFKLIDKHIRPMLVDSKLPLIIGGVENLLALYTKANSYGGLVGRFIHGNLDRATPDSIRAKAWPIIQER